MTSTFFVYLPSDSLDYTENRPNSYRVHLAKTINFQGNWVCGLHSISYPYSWPSTVGTLDDQWINIYFRDNQGREQILRVPIPKGSHKTVNDLKNFLSVALKYQSKAIETFTDESNLVEQPKIVSERKRQARDTSNEGPVDPPKASDPVDPPSTDIMQKVYGIRPRNKDEDIMNKMGVGKKQKVEEIENDSQSAVEQPAATSIPPSYVHFEQSGTTETNEQKFEIIENILIGNVIGEGLAALKAADKNENITANEKPTDPPKAELPPSSGGTSTPAPPPPTQSDIMQTAYGINPRDPERDVMKNAFGIRPRDPEKDVMNVQGISPRDENKPSDKEDKDEEKPINPIDNEYSAGSMQATVKHLTDMDLNISDLKHIIESIEIQYLKEFDRFMVIFKEASVTHISFTSQLGYVLGFENPKFVKNKEMAKYGCDLRGGFSSFGVYTKGLTENMIIGNTLSSLLRVVSISGAIPGEYTEKIYDSPIFCRVLPKEIKEIELELRTMDGRLVPFAYGTVMIVLIFKKIIEF